MVISKRYRNKLPEKGHEYPPLKNKRDKFEETEDGFKRRLGINYGTNAARKGYRHWRRKVIDSYNYSDIKSSYSKNAYVNYNRSLRILNKDLEEDV